MTNITLAEEILLLLLDEDKGTLRPIPNFTLHFVLAGAVLMELAINNRVDCGLESFEVINNTPTGDPILDRYLQKVSTKDDGNHEIKYWLNNIADDGEDLVNLGFKRLVERGVLGETERRFLWVVRTKIYPTLDGSVEHNAKLRLMSILYSDDIPDPREVVMFCLLDACDMFRVLLPAAEVTRLNTRIRNISHLDLIGIQTGKLIREIQLALVATHAPLF